MRNASHLLPIIRGRLLCVLCFVASVWVFPTFERALNVYGEAKAIDEIESEGGAADCRVSIEEPYVEVPNWISCVVEKTKPFVPEDWRLTPVDWRIFNPIVVVRLHDFEEPVDAGRFPSIGNLSELRYAYFLETRNANELVARIKHLKHLREISLFGSDIDDKSVVNIISRFADLRSLDLSFTRISDDGLKSLSGHPRIQELVLMDTAVSNASFDVFSSLPELESLYLQGTPISKEDVVKLKARIPGVAIYWAPKSDE